LFLCHPKPKDKAQAALWKRLVDNELKTPDTWEAGKDKKATFERLILEKKLGALALLRNLRNMETAKVADKIIATALEMMKVERVGALKDSGPAFEC
jgi:60 kDa SS-A/Ro ribonucleoprotein